MRFDDSLSTVLAADSAQGFGAQATWRQLVDLIGRARVPGDAEAIERLRALRSAVPEAVRAASARALAFAAPPASLVALFAEDELGIGAPVLRTAQLAGADWVALLPRLTPTQRSVLRHRRDLPAEAQRGLDSFGSVDFVLEDGSAAAPDARTSAAPSGALAASPEPPSAEAGPSEPARFEIADLVARIDAYRDKPVEPIAPEAPPMSFAYSTDPTGVIRWVEGIARGALLGVRLGGEAFGAVALAPAVAEAARTYARFAGESLAIAGNSDACGVWSFGGMPAYDPASGAFIGYRGAGRRRAVPRGEGQAVDSVRQLVHELRTPANAIAGFSELIETELLGPIAPPYRDRAGVIRAQAGMLTSAIDDLDTAARMESGALELRPVALALEPLLDQIVAVAQPQAAIRGAKVSWAPAGTHRVYTDDRAVEQLLSRLLAAIAAIAEQGEEIAVHVVAEGRALLDITVTRPRALAIPGASGSAAEPTNTEGAPLLGVGFSLRLARNLAQQLGGSLTIDADCLTLRLPAAEEERVGQAAH